ncbi:hypothetical protein SNEBB_002865 [Seison nebaliae]|nr:hypothetical protein SNEBB_002865 [Seison nebaliae]
MIRLLLIFGCVWSFCSGVSLLEELIGTSHEAELKEISRTVNQFSFKVYEQLFDKNENLIFSPASIATAMGLAVVGARGKTFQQLRSVLELPSDIQSVASEFGYMMKSFDSLKEVTMVNKMYVHNKMPLETSYRYLATEYFKADAQNVDFGGNKKKIVSNVNNWVSKNTNNLITKLLDESDITPLTRLILLNAIHFKGTWLKQFNKRSTRPSIFTLSNGRSSSIDMMNIQSKFRFMENSKDFDAKILSMPYEGDRLSFIIMLPNDKKKGFETISSKFDSELFHKVVNNLLVQNVQVSIPKFKIETAESLKKPLIDMGADNAFTGSANFQGISKKEDLYISDVLHKAVLDVNEEGTEAAAVTGVIMNTKSFSHHKPLQIICNRPFQYFIYDHKLNMILFAGHFANPNSIIQ